MLWAVVGGVCLVGGAWAVRRWVSRGWGRCTCQHSLRGKTVVVTGANSGLGREAASALVARGARVVLACRDLHKARSLVADLRRLHPRAGEMIAMQLDLESFESIRSFADVARTAFPKIDVLINNAGVYYPPRVYEITKEGHEIHFGVNHLGHFLLTDLLLDLLKKAAPSRVVIVSSTLHERGTVDFEDLNMRKYFDALKTDKKKKGRHNPGYCNSKLMNVYFGKELAERTKGTGVDVYCVCPGFTYTGLFRHSFKWYHFVLMIPFFLFYLRTAEQGVQTILHCALDPSLEGVSGGFYRNCKPYHSKVAFDKNVQEKLWEVSDEIVREKIKI